MLYTFAVLIFRLLLYPLLFPKFFGIQNAQDVQNTIIICTHRHWYDPALVAFAVKQHLHFMAKSELFQNRLLAFILRRCNAFPVDRGVADVKAIKTAIRTIKEGQPLLIFPEGTRIHAQSDEMLQFHNGVSFLAAKSGAQVLPVYIDSKRHGWRTVINFGDKIDTSALICDVERKQQVDVLNKALQDSMVALRAQTKQKNQSKNK